MNALELKGLEKHYPDFCLGPLDLTLPGGTICGLIGENGAGKSTTIRLILDILKRDGGSIRVLGQESSADPQRLKTEVGVVLEGGGLPGTMNPTQIGRMMADIYPNWDAAAYKDYCQRFGLPEKKVFGAFSRGMRMKQCIAVALSHHPKLLLLDEATSGLDPVARDELLDILLDFARDEEHSILISSHIVSDLEKLCDTIAFLHKGRLMLCEDKDTLREEYALWHGSRVEFAALDPAAVQGKRVTPYGVEALVRRAGVPQDSSLAPVSIEELFVMMVKGLLYKDLCQAKRSCRFVAAAVLVMMGIAAFAVKSGGWFLVAYAGMLMGTIPMSLLALDATSGWSVYQRTLPLSAEQIVGSKYLAGLSMGGLSAGMAALGGLVSRLLYGSDLPAGIIPQSIAIAVIISLAGNIVLLPVTFRFDQNKARVAYILFVCLMAGAMGVLMSSRDELPTAAQSGMTLALAAAAVVVLALYLLSWRVSVAWYPRHEK